MSNKKVTVTKIWHEKAIEAMREQEAFYDYVGGLIDWCTDNLTDDQIKSLHDHIQCKLNLAQVPKA